MNQITISQSSQGILDAVNSPVPFPVEFEKLWQWVGFTRKSNAKRVLDANFLLNTDYGVSLKSEQNPKGGRPSKELYLTLDAAKAFAMLAQTECGKAVRLAFIQAEKELQEIKAQGLPSPNVLASLCDAVNSIQSRLDAMAGVQTAAQAALAMIEPKPRTGNYLTLTRAYYRVAKRQCKRVIRFHELQHQAAQLTLALINNEAKQAKLAEGI